MKKIYLALIIAFTATCPAHAQLAIEGGLNMANMAFKVPTGFALATTYKAGAAMGIAVDMLLVDHIYFQPGLFFEQAGATITSVPEGSYTINTVTIPLNVEYKTGEKCGARFFFGAGAYYAAYTGGSMHRDAFQNFPATDGNIQFGQAIKSADFGIGLNVGYQLKKHFYGRLHYQQGLTNLGMTNDIKVTTSAIGATLGFLFGRCSGNRGNSAFGRSKGNHWRGMSKSRYSTRPKYGHY
jgi:hypothetical protein